jgi:hypothetical protein
LLCDAGRADVDVSLDVFLEQTQQPAAAGIVVRARDAQNMQRFLLDTDGPVVRVRIDTLIDGQRTDEVVQSRATPRRGFTLRVVAQGDRLTYFVDGERVHEQQRGDFASATQVGVLSGGHTPSRLDNLEVRAVE